MWLATYAILLATIYFSNEISYQYVIVGSVMLLLPLFDKGWEIRKSNLSNTTEMTLWLMVGFLLLAIWQTGGKIAAYLLGVLFSIIPEEIYFRAYLVTVLPGKNVVVLIVTSVMFAFAHLLTTETLHAILTVVPALVLGWLYIKYYSLSLVIVIHIVFNMIYMQTAFYE